MVWKGANLPYSALRYIPPMCLHGVERSEFTFLCLKVHPPHVPSWCGKERIYLTVP